MAEKVINFRFARPDEATAADKFHKDNPAPGVYFRDLPVIQKACNDGLYLLLTSGENNHIIGTAATFVQPSGNYAEFASMRVLEAIKDPDGTEFSLRGYQLSKIENMIQSVHAFLYAAPTHNYFADVKTYLKDANGVFTSLGWDLWENPPKELVDNFEASKSGDSRPKEAVNYYKLQTAQVSEFAKKLIELANNPVRHGRNGDQIRIEGLKDLPFYPYLERLVKAEADLRAADAQDLGWAKTNELFWEKYGGSTPTRIAAADKQHTTGWGWNFTGLFHARP